jgi:hypothetical protein
MSVMSWPTGSSETRNTAPIGEELSAEGVGVELAGAIDAANGL